MQVNQPCLITDRSLGRDTPLPSISQKLVYVADESSKLPTVLQYLSQPFSPPIMIFTSTQPRASSLAEQLLLNGVQNVDCLHAGMTMKERQEAALRMRRGESWIMICTEVMARGMDFRGVQGVINFDFPTSVQSYIHRIGMLVSERFRMRLWTTCAISRTYWKSWSRGYGYYLLYG